MVVDAVARVAHVVQHHEMHLADVEGVVFRTPFAAKGVEAVCVIFGVEVEIVVATDEILRYAAHRNDFLEAGVE